MALLKRTFSLLVLSTLSISVDVYAQHQQNSSPRQNLDKRRFQLQEFRANRRLERQAENQSGAMTERDTTFSRRDLSSSTPVINRDEKPVNKFNRLSPEERIALRRQIREARQEIYSRHQEKNEPKN
ncbi:hypothetical protein [Undibacterium flavidum]|uniref:Secreted protein n=1 Tax=Undibacterium flavidum TaxID=2762297 RepID=A0ABR6YHE1_9BURK|nr:hypothetical protein [Undibacterium flavidum]MBC3876000.1 hypothetical protein [Undibacterium flavidum]